jgi:hypothetical protein
VGGVPTDPTSVKLSDATGAYGVKRDDTGAMVVADGTDMIKITVGVYAYTFDEPDPYIDLTYTAQIEVIYNGATYRFEVDLVGATTPAAPITQTAISPDYYYTSRAEIERLWSINGAALHVSDYTADETAPGNDAEIQQTVWDDICIAATDEVNFYLLRFYESIDLQRNSWVRTRATWIAAHLLSLRRADPGYFQDMYDKALAQLDAINESRPVPRMNLKQEFTPSMSNMHVDDRFRIRKIRVEPTTSVGGVSSRQDLDPDVLLEPYYR